MLFYRVEKNVTLEVVGFACFGVDVFLFCYAAEQAARGQARQVIQPATRCSCKVNENKVHEQTVPLNYVLICSLFLPHYLVT